MKAAVLRSADGVPEYAEFADPEVGENEEAVELVAAGIHHLVRSRAHGAHYSSEGRYPLIPGVDAVARTADGTLIYTGNAAAPYGTMAERITVSRRFHFELPAGTEDRAAQVAGGMNLGMSSWLPLTARLSELPALGTVAVVGVTGASGLLAVQNAKDLGASRIIGIGRDEAGLERARGYGAETARLTDDHAASVAAIRELLADDSPSLILDYVWGAPAEAMFEALVRDMRDEDDADITYAQIGSLAGPTAALPSVLLRSRRIKVVGSGLGSVSTATLLAAMPEYVTRIAEGHVEVPVETYPLTDIARAWTAKPKHNARIVVTG